MTAYTTVNTVSAEGSRPKANREPRLAPSRLPSRAPRRERRALSVNFAAGSLALASLLAAGCRHAPGPGVAATVNGRPIELSEVEAYYRANLGPNPQTPTEGQADAARLGILRQLIDEEILQQRAQKLHLVATDQEVDAKLADMRAPYTQEEFDRRLAASHLTLSDLRKQIRRTMTSSKLMNKEVISRINITDADIAEFYNANKSQFDFIEPKYHIAEIVVTTHPAQAQQGANLQNSKAGNEDEARKKIELLHSRLESGDDFASVAMNFSENPNDASNGGDMGLIPESTLRSDPTVYAVISKLKPGEMSAVVPLTAPGGKTPAEYVIYKLLEVEPAGQRQLSDPRVQQDIRQQLRDSRAQLLRAAYYEILRDNAQVENYLARQIFDSSPQ